ncbi:hypothetical protein N9Z41_00885 [bacterium]|nr:hypothetical protein [bacterium]
MGLRFDSENTGKWWELLLAWKWPHEGFTIGYDLIHPDEQPENGLYYYSVLIYLGPLSIIYNFGNHDNDE